MDARFTGSAALDRTVTLLGGQLVRYLDLDGDERLRLKAAVLPGAVAAGYTTALLGVVLTEQEQIRQAALHARDRAEAALQASEARFGAVFTDAAVGIGIGDVAGRILDVNPRWSRCSATRRRSSAAVRSPTSCTPTMPRRSGTATASSSRAGGSRSVPRSDSSGPTAPRSGPTLTVSLIRGADGAPKFQAAIIEDITERHRLTERLAYQATTTR